MSAIYFEPIGKIQTPFTSLEGMPIQPNGGREIEGTIHLDSVYQAGLDDLVGFSHLVLIYFLHKSEGFSLKVKPFLDNQPRGLFSTRAPKRPNPIGLSVVRLIKIERNILHIKNIDILDGTPLLDIKPYVPQFDDVEEIRLGWLTDKVDSAVKTRADSRFSQS